MKAMLLCAGLGERMRPLTRTRPKPALPVLGRPMAVQNLLRLARHGVTDAAVNLHHLPDVLRSLLGDGRSSGLPTVHYTLEDPILGTAGGLRHAAEHLRGAGPIVVHNSDFLSDIDIGAALDAHRRSGNLATLVLAEPRDGFSGVDVDAEGRVLAVAGLPESAAEHETVERCLFTGLQILDESVLDRIPGPGPSNVVRDVHAPLIREGRLGSYRHRGFWWEFGSPAAYHEGSMQALDLPPETLHAIGETDPVVEIAGARVALGADVEINPGARIEGKAAIGAGCRIAEGARITDSVVMPGATVGAGAVLDRAIVGPSTVLPAGLEVESAVVCPDEGANAGLLRRPF
jgi:NDP-sugar pyrophosphorylase family protein